MAELPTSPPPGTYDPCLDSFKQMIQDVFYFSPLSESAPPHGLSHTSFWSDLFVPRHDEHARFDAFLRSPQLYLLCVSGTIGCGKSTLILDKLENSRLCQGVYLNLERDTGELDSLTEADCRRALDMHVVKALQEQLYRHFVRVCRGEIDRRDFWVDSTFHWEPTVRTQLRRVVDTPAQLLAWGYVAAVMLMWRTDREALAMRRALEAEAPGGGWPTDWDDAVACVARALVERQDIRDAILTSYEPCEWLNAYAATFDGPPPVVVFDNVDALWRTTIHSVIFTYICDLALACNRPSLAERRDYPYRPPLKVVLGVRDHNLRRLSPSPGASVPADRIVLGAQSRPLDTVSTHYRPLTPALMNDIIEKRLAVAIRLCPPDAEWQRRMSLFTEFVKRFWIVDDGDHSLPPRKAELLHDLNNHSIRLALDMVVEFTTDVIQDITRTGRKIEDYLDRRRRLEFRGRIIRWFATAPDSEPVIVATVKQLESVKAGDSLCDTYRLVLTFLMAAESKLRRDQPVTAGELATDVGKLLGLRREQMFQILLNLFCTGGKRKGEFVEIYQEQCTTDKWYSVQESATIGITHRGRALLDYILLALDFWGFVAYYPMEAPLLFELTPEGAVKYLRKVLAYVRAIACSHAKAWIDEIAPHWPCGDDVSPFRYYANDFVVKGCFYLQRVADSHRTTIKDYAYETLRGKDTGIMMAEQDAKGFLEEWTDEKGACAEPQQAMRHITATEGILWMGGKWLASHARGGIKASRILRELVMLEKKYQRVHQGFYRLSMLTKRQIHQISADRYCHEYFGDVQPEQLAHPPEAR